MLFHYHPIYGALQYNKLLEISEFRILKSHDHLVLCETHLSEMGSTQNMLDHDTSSIACHVELFIHSNFVGPVGPQALL